MTLKTKEMKYHIVELTPMPYCPIGKGLAIVSIEDLVEVQKRINKFDDTPKGRKRK